MIVKKMHDDRKTLEGDHTFSVIYASLKAN